MKTILGLAIAIMVAASPTARRLEPFSSELSDYNLSVDDAGRFAVFARSEAEFARAAIFYSERRDGRWTTPRRIEFSNPAWADSDPWLTPDGRTVYFISSRPAPGRDAERQDYDVWRVHRTRRGWSEPEHLGPEINGRGQELGPELHGKTLYFSAARRSGLGGLDIYQARMKGGAFEPARLVEGPFNTSESESDFTLSRDGRIALFWRMTDDKGMLHIAQLSAKGWSEPTVLSPRINVGRFNFTPSFTGREDEIWFASIPEGPDAQPGMADIFSVRLTDPRARDRAE
jgi:hypothetical protein